MWCGEPPQATAAARRPIACGFTRGEIFVSEHSKAPHGARLDAAE
jgi:hypothetical protein